MINRILSVIEKKAAYYQGRGWGAGTIRQEFSQAIGLLESKDVKLCIDIGGNRGTYTDEIIRQYPTSKVVVFEPASVNITALNEKYTGYKNVVVEPFGVSDTIGETNLFSNEEGSGLASLTKRRLDHFNIEFDKTEQIKTIVFEKYWKENLLRHKIDICKIDIEGHELDALRGFGDALRYINVIQFEFGGCNIDTRTFFQDFWYFFTNNGYEIYRISPLGAIKVNRYNEIDEFFTTTNYLAKRIN